MKVSLQVCTPRNFLSILFGTWYQFLVYVGFIRVCIPIEKYPKWNGSSKRGSQRKCYGDIHEYWVTHLPVYNQVMSRVDNECSVKSYLSSYLPLGRRRVMSWIFGMLDFDIFWRNIRYFLFRMIAVSYFPLFIGHCTMDDIIVR